MILDFGKYKAFHNNKAIDPVLIYPGLNIHVRRLGKNVHIMGLPHHNATDFIVAECETKNLAERLLSDIDIFLQYKTHELPEYTL